MFDNLVGIFSDEDSNYLTKSEDERKKIEDTALEKFMSYLMIIKSSNDIYKDLKENMRQQHSLDNKQYPETLHQAMGILNENYKRPKSTTTSNTNTNQEKPEAKSTKDEEVRSFAQTARTDSDFRCFKYGRSSCKGGDACTHKDKPKKEWAANRAMALADNHFAQVSDDASVGSAASSASRALSAITTQSPGDSRDWTFLQVFQFAEVPQQDLRLSNCILLDNQSGKSLFCNPKLVTGIHKSPHDLYVHTNADVLTISQKVTLPGFQTIWLSPTVIANVLSFAEVRDKKKNNYKVHYEPATDQFNVTNIKYRVTDKEIGQIHGRECIKSTHLRDLTDTEASRAMEALTVLLRKKSGIVKARTVANGSVQRNRMSKEEITSPTASTESVLMTALVDAVEERYVVMCDLPNAFIQAMIDTKPGEPRMVLVIRGILVDMLCKIAPEIYTQYV